ncbi:hypothetical protein [EBPR siphovirus 2]|nr:hypothetical protein [EBPR siphovirus 2]
MHKAVAESEQASRDVTEAVVRRKAADDPLRSVISDLLTRLDERREVHRP